MAKYFQELIINCYGKITYFSDIERLNKIHVRPAKTQISLGIRPVWSESSLCVLWVAKDPQFLHVHNEDWSDWADVKADLSLCWAHRSFCWFLNPEDMTTKKAIGCSITYLTTWYGHIYVGLAAYLTNKSEMVKMIELANKATYRPTDTIVGRSHLK